MSILSGLKEVQAWRDRTRSARVACLRHHRAHRCLESRVAADAALVRLDLNNSPVRIAQSIAKHCRPPDGAVASV